MPLEDPLIRKPAAVVFAHPDDETIGAGGLIPQLRDPVFIHVTDGAPGVENDAARLEYARVRRSELLAALELAGISADRLRQLGLIDQQASLNLAGLARRIAGLLRELGCGVVLTHAYEGGHPDHDATAFAVQAACRLVAEPPEVWEFTSYHARAGDLIAGEFLNGATAPRAAAFALSGADRARKEAMFACYPSQRDMLRKFPIGVERFRPAPRYDFTLPPHSGQLFYEQFEWGMTGERFRALARRALEELGIGGAI